MPNTLADILVNATMRGNQPRGGQVLEPPGQVPAWATYAPLPEGWLPPGANWNANPPQVPENEFSWRAKPAPRFHVPPGKELAPPGGQVSMRPGDPTAGRPPPANFIPPNWWQGGGPQRPPPRPTASLEDLMRILNEGMTGPPGPPMGFSLEGRSRMDSVLGTDAERTQRLLDQMDELRRKDAEQQGRRERIPPRNYGKGQLI